MASHPAPHINLLSKKKIVFDEQLTLASRVKKVAGMTLVVYGVVLALVVGINIFITQQINGINMSLEQVKMTLAASQVLISQYEKVSSRVGTIQTLMNERQEVVNLWQQLQALVPEGCTLSQFSIKDKVLAVSIQSPHMVLANKVLDMITPALPSLGSTKTIARISRSEDASYRIDFELALKKEIKKE